MTGSRNPEGIDRDARFDRAEPEVPGQLWRAYRKLHISRNNVLNDMRRWLSLSVLGRPITDIWPYEKKVYSQHGEDGVLDAIFRVIGTTSRFYVEFGTGDAMQRNTRFLAERRDWSGLLMDGGFENAAINLRREFITAENINELFARYDVPHDLDLLSIDIDGNDYWVWENIDAVYRPRVIVAEYNASLGPTERLTIPYDPGFVWDGSDHFGASLAALEHLGARKGYRLVGCESMGVNAFFVRSDLLAGRIVPRPAIEAYRPPIYGTGSGHPRDPSRRMVAIPSD